MTRLSFFLLLPALVTLTWNLEDAPKPKIPLSAIKRYKVFADGRQYEAYEGIPYTLLPIGKFRFKVKNVNQFLIQNSDSK